MKVVVTGGTGFLGRHLVRELENRNMYARVLDRAGGPGLIDKSWALEQIEEEKPDAVIHLAAKCGGIGANMAKPGEFFRDNLLMGVHLIDACRKLDVPKTVVVGTVCSYPKFTSVPFREEDIWDGFPEKTNAPYGVAKKALLVMLQAYRQQYLMNGIYLIPVNLFGPGDCFDPNRSHVIPALILKFWQAKQRGDRSVTCWGTGSASREFLYVEDAAQGITDALEQYDGSDPVNLGNGREHTIADLSETIKRIVGFKGEIVWDNTKPDGQPRRCLDTSKAKELFGFEAATDLEDGLKKTYEWFLQQPMGCGC